eukprot:scaffold16092_cov127-Isochrysis_galbana.AAC.8
MKSHSTSCPPRCECDRREAFTPRESKLVGEVGAAGARRRAGTPRSVWPLSGKPYPQPHSRSSGG